jgi:hypothetical protein
MADHLLSKNLCSSVVQHGCRSCYRWLRFSEVSRPLDLWAFFLGLS